MLARERVWRFGTDNVSDSELIALLLGSGTRGLSVWKLASLVLERAGGVGALSRASPQEIIVNAGIGMCRAVRIAAGFELGRRAFASHELAPTLRGPEDIARLMAPKLTGLVQECFYVVGLGSRSQLLADVPIARGTLQTVEVHPREVYRPLIRMAAAAAVVVHNHPSGDPTPSDQDVELTRRLIEVGHLVGIPLVDHVIVAGNQFRSITEWAGLTL